MGMPNDIEFETAVMIPSDRCGIVIGQRGRNIKRIRELTGVRAFLEQEDPEMTDKKPLYLTGSIQGVQTAMTLVNDLLNGRGFGRSLFQPVIGRGVMPLFASSSPYYFPSGGGGGSGDGGGGASNAGSKFEQARITGRGVEVEVPGFAVGFIIGKRGDQIRALSEQTGTNIQFNRNDTLRNSEVHHAYIEGSPEQVEKCIERMNEMVTKLYDEICSGQRFGVSGAGNPSSQLQQSQFLQSAPALSSQPGSFAQSSSNQQQWAAAVPLAQSGYYSGIQQQQQPQLDTQTGTMDWTPAWIEYYETVGDHQQANLLREGLRQQQAQSAMAVSIPTSGSSAGAGGLLASVFPNMR